MAIGTPVQVGNNGAGSGSATLNVTVANAVTAGDLILVFIAWNDPAQTITAINDSAGNTYTSTTAENDGTASAAQVWYCKNAAALSAAQTISVQWSSTTPIKGVTVISVSGMNTTAPLDITATATTGTGTAPSSATGTLGQADELVVGSLMINTGRADAFTQSSGFTANSNANPGVSSILRSAYKIVAVTTGETYAPTLGTSRGFAGRALSFKDAGASADTLFAQAIF